jgi:GT2 family glycosyltransferase
MYLTKVIISAKPSIFISGLDLKDDQRPDCSVVIVNTNTRHLLIPCLRSLFDNTEKSSLEVFVVDNNSSDGSVDAIEVEFPQVKLIANDRNRGFTEANNQAIPHCTGRYIYCLNPDTLVLDRAVDILVEFMDKHLEAGAVGSNLLNPDLSLQPTCRAFITPGWMILKHLFPKRLFPKLAGQWFPEYFPHDHIREVDWVIGASIMVRRQTLEDVGLKDERYFIFHEETDWCFRIKKAGWKVYFVPQARIIHYGGQTVSRMWGNKVILEYYKGKHLFLKKNYGSLTLLWHRLFLGTLLSVRLVVGAIKHIVSRSDRDQWQQQKLFLTEGIKLQIRPDVDHAIPPKRA